MENYSDIIIIGGGASGMVAAIVLSDYGSVRILEKNSRLGKKLLATGNGRCNLTNEKVEPSNYNTDFVTDVIKRYNTSEILEFFSLNGLECTKENGRYYPISLKSNSVLNVLLNSLDRKKVMINCDSYVIDINKKKLFEISTKDEKYYSKFVILASGGASMPSLGADVSALNILKKFGHNLINLRPSLTKLSLNFNSLRQLAGTKVKTEVSLYEGHRLKASSYGELLFTNYGISGPPVLDISKYAKRGDIVKFSLINDYSKQVRERILNRYYILNDLTIGQFLSGIVDKNFVHYLCKKLDIKHTTLLYLIDEQEFLKLLDELEKTEMEVKDILGFSDSQVTQGGIALKDIDPHTMESKLIDGLYIIGEALDVDGDCGGYNLHWAFASAMASAVSIGGICTT